MHNIVARSFIFASLVWCLFLLVACGKEAPLHPPLGKDAYQLPQGNKPFDDSIVAFHKRYGTYILYKFSHKDFAFSATGLLTDTAAQGDEAYIAATLAFFNNRCLAFYSESFRKKSLPFKIILSANVGTPLPDGIITPSSTGFALNMEMLAIGWTNDRLAAQSPVELKKTIASMHRHYMVRAVRGYSFPIPPEFVALFPLVDGMDETNKYQRGMLEVQNANTKDQSRDFGSYVEAITGKTTAELEAGILSSRVDVNGLVRKKYNILLKFFREQYGFDLAAVGNQP